MIAFLMPLKCKCLFMSDYKINTAQLMFLNLPRIIKDTRTPVSNGSPEDWFGMGKTDSLKCRWVRRLFTASLVNDEKNLRELAMSVTMSDFTGRRNKTTQVRLINRPFIWMPNTITFTRDVCFHEGTGAACVLCAWRFVWSEAE